MFGYMVAKIAEAIAKDAGASEDAAKATGMAVATASTIVCADPTGMVYIGETAVRQELKIRNEKPE